MMTNLNTKILFIIIFFFFVLFINNTNNISLKNFAYVPSGIFDMGDHHDLGGQEHKNDEIPVHKVSLDFFYISIYEVTNKEYCEFLNQVLKEGFIELKQNDVYLKGKNIFLCKTFDSADYSKIKWHNNKFIVLDNKENHPMTGVMWEGATVYCNWLSNSNGYENCYDFSTMHCDFSKKGYRLPTEAEWEYAARGGKYNPYFIFSWGDDPDFSKANWPKSGDPFEEGDLPYTTPVGFYNGKLHNKEDFNWPGKQKSYQTSNGINGYGLYDTAGNVWEWCNDIYHRDYYSFSSEKNPRGPETGSIMPDGKVHHVLRGGSWYNGEWGHSRVSNRNPAYYRGPKDPDHEWYQIGFRVVLDLNGIGGTVDKVPEEFLKRENRNKDDNKEDNNKKRPKF